MWVYFEVSTVTPNWLPLRFQYLCGVSVLKYNQSAVLIDLQINFIVKRMNLSAEICTKWPFLWEKGGKNITWWLCLLSAASCEEWSLMLFPASVSSVWKGEKQHRRIQENNTLTLGLYKTQCEHSQTLLLISVVSCVLRFSYSSAQLHTHHWHPALWYQVS